jgi:hypothetical protein
VNDSREEPGHARYFFDGLISGLGRRVGQPFGNCREIPDWLDDRPALGVFHLKRIDERGEIDRSGIVMGIVMVSGHGNIRLEQFDDIALEIVGGVVAAVHGARQLAAAGAAGH